ncbi:MAG: hypothetical protein DWQ44_05150 [Bacteroidetes bacterium]|nr:MAG: hypothetical protein DWQ33_11795 [Bacteroidota bacterium]REK00763.1 MAG: hypothetical protein DWQ39_11470 [Bacteroidota bacterium]REK35011.1 MAG: hypothetical protein DWQ44_05150 [Bacteroidota bacterium]REK48191.1 MAG: hypothetical protein DWQ48_10195 [Bacteroidota bacterium]
MSLSKQQKKDLDQLGEFFKKIEKLTTENKIDLDVFITDYQEGEFSVYATEKVSLSEKAKSRKRVFEKAGNKSKADNKKQKN